jgi:hypothetical protein
MTGEIRNAEAYEAEVARHMVRHALTVAPVVVLGAGLLRGVDGAISAAIAFVLLAGNLLLSARLIQWAAHRSLAAMQAAVLGGYLVRLAALGAIVFGLSTFSWIDVPVLVLTLAVAHLALLVWELRFVSLSLAAPGLKPVLSRPER